MSYDLTFMKAEEIAELTKNMYFLKLSFRDDEHKGYWYFIEFVELNDAPMMVFNAYGGGACNALDATDIETHDVIRILKHYGMEGGAWVDVQDSIWAEPIKKEAV